MASRKRRLNTKTLAILIMVLTGGLIVYTNLQERVSFLNTGTQRLSASTKVEMDFNLYANPIFAVQENGFAACNQNAIHFFRFDGRERWSDGYAIQNPSVVTKGNKICVSETMGNLIRVYDDEGLLYALETEDTISQVMVNANGYLSVILYGSDDRRVQVYGPTGQILLERVDAGNNVYPLSSDISSDNSILAVSYVDATGMVLESKVLLFYIEQEKGLYYEGNMFAAQTKEETIIPTVYFGRDNVLFAIADSQVFGLNANLDPGKGELGDFEIWQMPLHNEITRAVSYDNMVAVVLGDAFPGDEGYDPETIIFISSQGQEMTRFAMPDHVSYLKSGKTGIVAGGGTYFCAFNSRGAQIWEYKASQDILDMLPLNTLHEVLFVTRTSVEIMKVQSGSNIERRQETTSSTGSGDTNEQDTPIELESDFRDESLTDFADETGQGDTSQNGEGNDLE